MNNSRDDFLHTHEGTHVCISNTDNTFKKPALCPRAQKTYRCPRAIRRGDVRRAVEMTKVAVSGLTIARGERIRELLGADTIDAARVYSDTKQKTVILLSCQRTHSYVSTQVCNSVHVDTYSHSTLMDAFGNVLVPTRLMPHVYTLPRTKRKTTVLS